MAALWRMRRGCVDIAHGYRAIGPGLMRSLCGASCATDTALFVAPDVATRCRRCTRTDEKLAHGNGKGGFRTCPGHAATVPERMRPVGDTGRARGGQVARRRAPAAAC